MSSIQVHCSCESVVPIDVNLLKSCSYLLSVNGGSDIFVPASKRSVDFVVAIMQWSKSEEHESLKAHERAAANMMCAEPKAAEGIAIEAVHAAVALQLRDDVVDFMFGEMWRWHSNTPICVTPGKWLGLTSIVALKPRTGSNTRMLFAHMLQRMVDIARADKWLLD